MSTIIYVNIKFAQNFPQIQCNLRNFLSLKKFLTAQD